MSTSVQSAPPMARVVPQERIVHGDLFVDNYFWLREKSSPEVIAYLEEENAYTRALMEHTRPLQEKLYREMVSRVKQTDLSVPYLRRGYYYYTRTEEGKQYGIHCRRHGSLDAPEEILIDENELAQEHSYFNLSSARISPDGNLAAYAWETTGAERYTLYVKDLRTGAFLPETIDNVSGSMAWANDNVTLFYVTLDDARRAYKVFRHTLGTDPKDDILIYHETDDAFNIGVGRTKSDAFVTMRAMSQITTEYSLLDADDPTGEFRVVLPRVTATQYRVLHHGDDLYILTNNAAVNFRLVKAPVLSPGPENWQEVISHREDTLLVDVDEFQDFLVLTERRDGLNAIRVLGLVDGADYLVDFPESVYTVYTERNEEFRAAQVRLFYTSLVTPHSIYDFDMRTRKMELKKRTEVLGGFDASSYHTERIHAVTADGARVPISLVYRRGINRDGLNPTLLYGYGAYGITIDPTFMTSIISLLDRGFIYAIAHIRGGQDLGRPWYEQGKFLYKRNSFTDFIACAEELIRERYTSADRLSIKGGSAGGLLVGAVANLRPDLFKAVVAHVPFVDVVNTMLDPTLPLTVGEYEEWGNPADKVYYDYIRSYSPYENTEAKEYPNMLVTAGLNDPRVSYWEPAKWVARLRAVKTDKNLLLLKTDMGSGHGGPSGRYDYLRDLAFEYAFLLDLMGISD